MMAERASRWSRAIRGLILCWGLLSTVGAWAAGFDVVKASTQLEKGVYRLNAQIEYRLSAPALDALQNGVPLTIELEMEVLKHRPWLWDEKVYSLNQRYRLEYHALSRQYLVSNLNSGERRGFPTRSGALQFMGEVNNFPFLDQGLLTPGEHYDGGLRARLDIEALPAPLRLMAYFSDDWRLISEWYIWPL